MQTTVFNPPMPIKIIVNLLQRATKQTALVLTKISSETYGTAFWNKEILCHTDSRAFRESTELEHLRRRLDSNREFSQ